MPSDIPRPLSKLTNNKSIKINIFTEAVLNHSWKRCAINLYAPETSQKRLQTFIRLKHTLQVHFKKNAKLYIHAPISCPSQRLFS